MLLLTKVGENGSSEKRERSVVSLGENAGSCLGTNQNEAEKTGESNAVFLQGAEPSATVGTRSKHTFSCSGLQLR